MINAKFTIKNYRCFSEEDPLEFNFKDGFTAFIGPNNSGKSQILKFFYEFRNIWKLFFNRNFGRSLATFNRITDNTDVFYKFNDNPIQISIEIENFIFKFSVVHNVNYNNFYINDIKFLLNGKKLIPIPDISGSYIKIGNNKVFLQSNNGEIDISLLINFFNVLMESIYIPAFRNIVNIGENANYYDISIGESFIKTFSAWKLGNYSKNRQIIYNVTEDIKNLFNYNNLEINPSDDKKNMLLTIDGKVYKLDEVGSGIAHFILVFINAAIKNPSFILIDEPELNLHPSLQLKFLTTLGSYAKNGVLFSTHSIGLARSAAETIYSVIKKGNYSSVRLFEKTPNYSELLGELSFGLYQELGINKVLLVEGPTEVKVFQQFLRKIRKDRDFLIISLGGSSMINGKREHELSELTRITKNIYCWIDSEKKSKDESLSKGRYEFLEICRKLEIKIRVSERRAIENYFTENAIKKVLGENYNVLSEYEKPHNWDKSKNWLIAKEMSFDDIKNTDLGNFIEEICNE